MIEKIIFDYLNGLEDAPAPALMEIPEGGITPPCWIIQKTAGGELDGDIGTPTIAIQSYGATLYEAAQLNEALKAAMKGVTALPEIARCKLNSDYDFTDTTKRLHRYQAVFDVIHY